MDHTDLKKAKAIADGLRHLNLDESVRALVHLIDAVHALVNPPDVPTPAFVKVIDSLEKAFSPPAVPLPPALPTEQPSQPA